MKTKPQPDALIARCTCGKVEIKAIGSPVIAASCHCSDCFSGSSQLEALPHAPRILDSFGGTPHLLYRKDRVEFLKGTELFKNIQVDEDSPKRAYSGCCNSYLFLDVPSPMQWLPIHRNRFESNAPKIEMRINAKFKTKALKPTDVPTYEAFPIKFVFKLLSTLPSILLNRSAKNKI